MNRNTFRSLTAMLQIGALVIGIASIASAQYGSPYPYPSSQPPAQRLPNSALRVGGFTGNPYRNSTVRPTGLPLGGVRTHSYFGVGGQAGGNPIAHRSVQKPFANLSRPRPLITSREAARIEVARGLWRY